MNIIVKTVDYLLVFVWVCAWLLNINVTCSSLYSTFFMPYQGEHMAPLIRFWMREAGFILSYLWAIFVIVTPLILMIVSYKKFAVSWKAGYFYLVMSILFCVGVYVKYISEF